MKKCAVIIAAFNAGRCIERCLKTVDAQEPLDGWRYEVRVGVDGCQVTARALQRIKRAFYFSRENRGTYVMANSLIALGKADVYARFDADDLMLPDYLATVIPVALDHGICHAPHILGGKRFSKPRVGQVTFTAEVLERLGGFRGARVHSDRDFTRRAAIAGYDIRAMRADKRLKRGLFIHNVTVNSLTRSVTYGWRSKYRREVRDEMARLRADGEIKINPQTVTLCEKSFS